MIGKDANEVRKAVLADYEATAPKLNEPLRRWLRSHLIPPRKIELARKSDGASTEPFWLITDHSGTDDALFRLVYDDTVKRYGIECAIQNGICLFAGFRESLEVAVVDIKGVTRGVG